MLKQEKEQNQKKKIAPRKRRRSEQKENYEKIFKENIKTKKINVSLGKDVWGLIKDYLSDMEKLKVREVEKNANHFEKIHFISNVKVSPVINQFTNMKFINLFTHIHIKQKQVVYCIILNSPGHHNLNISSYLSR